MHSKLANVARSELREHIRGLTPGQRLEAFVRHSQSVAELARARRRTVTAPARS